jgi:putative oxidoreductase
MNALRTVGRGLIAAIFIIAGIDVLRRPEGRAEAAHEAIDKVRSVVPTVPDDVTSVRANAAVQVIAATLFVLGKAPRAAAAVLAASLVPTTLAGHPFWKEEDPERSAQQRAHFVKNLAILGGLILAALPCEEDD